MDASIYNVNINCEKGKSLYRKESDGGAGRSKRRVHKSNIGGREGGEEDNITKVGGGICKGLWVEP